MSGRKRHLLVGTEGLLVKVKVHSAKVPDKGGIRLLLEPVCEPLPRLSHLWVDAGYQGRGKKWAEQELSLSVEVVHRIPKPTTMRIARIWAEEWSKEGREINWQKELPRRGFKVLPQGWVVERTFAWLSQNRRMSKDNERLCATEAFVYAGDESADGQAAGAFLGLIRQPLRLPRLLFGGRSLFQVFSGLRMKRQIASPTGQQNMEGSRGLYLVHELYIVPKEAAHNRHPLRTEQEQNESYRL